MLVHTAFRKSSVLLAQQLNIRWVPLVVREASSKRQQKCDTILHLGKIHTINSCRLKKRESQSGKPHKESVKSCCEHGPATYHKKPYLSKEG